MLGKSSGAFIRAAASLCLLLSAAGCGLMKTVPEPEDVRISEVRRSIHCGTEQRHAALSYFPTPEDWLGWQADRGLQIVSADKLPDGPLLLLEMDCSTSRRRPLGLRWMLYWLRILRSRIRI